MDMSWGLHVKFVIVKYNVKYIVKYIYEFGTILVLKKLFRCENNETIKKYKNDSIFAFSKPRAKTDDAKSLNKSSGIAPFVHLYFVCTQNVS